MSSPKQDLGGGPAPPCGGSCCSSSADGVTATRSAAGQDECEKDEWCGNEQAEKCTKGCCEDEGECRDETAQAEESASCAGSCCGEIRPSAACCGGDEGCCSKSEANIASAAKTLESGETSKATDPCADGCCAPMGDADCRGKEPAMAKCGDSCCASDDGEASVDLKGESSTGCIQCDEKAAKEGPCCNDSCLVRLAIRECNDNHEDSAEEPCEQHMNATRSRYGHILEALGCICRALAALNLESCCEQGRHRGSAAQRGAIRRRSCESRRSAKRARCISQESLCKERRSSTTSRDVRGGCCSPSKSCCEDTVVRVNKGLPAPDACCSQGTCRDRKSCEEPVTSAVREKAGFAQVADVEKGPTATEHVALAIQGMTCTGCETKLFRTLAAMPGISNIQTSLVLSRAEFDVNVALATIEDAVVQLRRATGFDCEPLSKGGHEIEVLAVPDVEDLPLGVTEVKRIDGGLVRIIFDAKLIGARDLITRAFGEPLALAAPRPDPTISAGRKHLRYVGWMTAFSAVATIPVLVLEWAPLPPHDVLYGSVSLALATIIQLVVAGPFYPAALKSLIFARVIEMDLLIVLSTSAAYVFSVIAFALLVQGRPLSTGEFFETSTLLVTLIMLGRYMSALARQKAVESITIRSLQQSTAVLVKGGGEVEEIDARLLQYGDLFRVLPDTRVVTDGTVLSGTSEVDESMMTGESRPVEKKTGSAVVAGSVNGCGTLEVRLTRLPGDNTISTIANMVDEAKLSKPSVQHIADRIAGYFVPVVCALAIITFVCWLAVGITRDGMSGSQAAVQATTYTVAVLIISCPCAIGLAVPMVIVIAGGVAADHGVVFKTAATVETARKASHVIFDKTGTLTHGKPSIVEQILLRGSGQHLASDILGLVSGNRHPVSSAIAAHLKSNGVAASKITNVKTLTGKGVQGSTASGETIRAGNAHWLGVESEAPVIELLHRLRGLDNGGLTLFCVTIDGNLRALFVLRDGLRPEAGQVVSALQSRGITVSIVSGDDKDAVEFVASQLAIPVSFVKWRCSPEDKQRYIQGLLTGDSVGSRTSSSFPGQSAARLRKPIVIFIGDGTNDAPALAAATIGIHMASSSDSTIDSAIARSAADAVLVRPDLHGLLVLLNLSRAAMNRVAFNFAWSAVYNVFAILLAAGAFVSAGHGTLQVRVPPAYAGLGEIVSVLPVIVVATLLKWAKLE